MPSESETPTVASSRLRLFLVAGVRLVGVILALALTKCHSPESVYNELPVNFDSFEALPIVITAAIVVYNIIAGALTMRCESRGVMPIVVILLDAFVGIPLTHFFGPAYLLLSFTLPVLTTGLYYGNASAISGLVIGGLFYSAVLGWSFVSKLGSTEQPEMLMFAVKLTCVEAASTLLLLWVFCSAIAEGDNGVAMEGRLQREKDMLFQELQTAKSDANQVYSELADSEGKIKIIQRDNAGLKEELETHIRRLQEARVAVQNAEKNAEEQGREAAQSARREKIVVQRQLAVLQQRLERQNRLFEVSRKLSGSLALSDTLLVLTEQLQAFLPCQSCVIFMIDEVQGRRELFAEVAATPFTDVFRTYSTEIKEDTLPGFSIINLEPIKVDDCSREIGKVTLKTIVDEERSALVAPLAIPTPTQPIGVVYLGRADAGAFTEDELDLLVEFCEMASVPLANSLLYQKAVTQGLKDSVTNCHNGLFLEERLREELKRGNRYMYSVSLILIDLDGFSQINEALGKDVGDCVLRETGDLIGSITRETDVLARLEGDDFALLLDHSDRTTSFEVGKRICEMIDNHVYTFGGRKIRITASVGVAGSPHDAGNAEQLTTRADAAVKLAKSQGGNQVAFWNGG